MNIESLKADVQRWGWARSIFIRVVRRLRNHLQIYFIRVRPLAGNPPDPNLPSGVSLRILDRATLLAASEDPELDLSRAWVESALAHEGVAFGAFDGATLVAYMWRTLSVAPHLDGLLVKVDRPYRYGYKALTRPKYRGRHINAAVSFFSDAYFLERGYTKDIGFVDVSNVPSLETAKYKGNTSIGFAGYVKCFGRCFTFRTPAVRRTGFEFLR